MKFRADVVERNVASFFAKLVASSARINKTVVIRITDSGLNIIFNERLTVGPMSFWVDMPKDRIFETYTFAGMMPDNYLYLQANFDHLAQALRTINQQNTTTKFKLLNKYGPCLTVEIEQPSLGANPRIIIHDVPVEIIGKKFWDDYVKPSYSTEFIDLVVPSLKTFKNMVDKLRVINSKITISVCEEGGKELVTMRAETLAVEFVTSFKGKPIASEIINTDNRFGFVEFESKKLAAFLSGQIIAPQNDILLKFYLVSERLIHFEFHSNTFRTTASMQLPHIGR